MTIWRLIVREIRHRALNFALGFISVSVAVACLIAALGLLRTDEATTRAILAKREAEVAEAGAKLEDSMRKITKGLGFNVVIVPEDQDLAEMHLHGSLSKTMPESYVDRLANSKIVTVNHLLPTVVKRIEWKEMNISVLLYGTRGEVPIAHRDPKKPLLDAVPAGSMIVGHAIQQKLNLKKGVRVKLMDREFEIIKTHDERGSIDDTTIWINLKEAQEMLGMENLIHAIQALECHCAGDRIAMIREEITKILPGVQAVERGSQALARAEARTAAANQAKDSLAREQEARATLRLQREKFAGTIVPVVLFACALSIGLLAFNNARQRAQEIAVLRAIGLRSSQIVSVFLGKAALLGVTGALAGFGGGLLAASQFADPTVVGGAVPLPTGQWLLLSLLLAPALAAIGSWIPAMMAANQDPAIVLQKD